MKTIIAELQKSPTNELSIRFHDLNGKTIRYYDTPECTEEQLAEFVKKCNSNEISLEHVDELICDFMISIL